ncbi:hypothetical protein B1813_15035 [Saccharomonospora piscinae]|uniref:DUF3558 domain-containing protein n=1 Tax=Saccharomonospora piscinae TaxID=687388 RepID=A0A1V9A1E6_SACPI|nr:DUF3558 family protein [Saccharomonospora piscinae]OQO90838.1 hypothetical protein B1813_15035 [Saccharomonospora piscinae]
MSRLKSAKLALPLLVAAAVVTGCASGESGIASPGVTDQPDGTNTVPGTPTSSPGAGLSAVDACSLLTPTELRAVANFDEGTSKTVGTGRTCEWKENSSEEDASILTATIRENGGIDGIEDKGYGTRSGAIGTNGREVVEVPTRVGCVVAMAVGADERVEVGVGHLGEDLNRTEMCQTAGKVVELIDPKLPQG